MSKKFCLVSVSDKSSLKLVLPVLKKHAYTLLSTGGTYEFIKKNGFEVISVDEYTSHPEILEGRVKTLHPKIHGGILYKRENEIHKKTILDLNISPIDIVIVNLYPFKETISKKNVAFEEAIENIDIGGPSLIRGAAKNFNSVCVLTNPDQYEKFIEEIESNNGLTSFEYRKSCAFKAFSFVSSYDSAIASFLKPQNVISEFPEKLDLTLTKSLDLRYGENPHQKAAFYTSNNDYFVDSFAKFETLQGKQVSYNNIADSNAAWEIVQNFSLPSCAIVKHANPSGVSIAKDLSSAYDNAFKCDPVSAFGGIYAFNKQVNDIVANKLVETFVEVIIAPNFSTEALNIFKNKPNVRLLKVNSDQKKDMLDFKKVSGGILLQTTDDVEDEFKNLKVVTKKHPENALLKDLKFAWYICKYVKSNAIVFVKDKSTVAIGAGQMSRLDSVRIAEKKALENSIDLQGSVVASDAFFPFRDTVDEILKLGVSGIIHPGGSIKDGESIIAANDKNIVMLNTGIRHFRH